MRSLSPSNEKRYKTRTIGVIAFLAEGAWTLGCGAGSAPPRPPPPSIEVAVNPANGSLLLGGQVTFTATVTNTTGTAVTWSIDGVPSGNATLGRFTSPGVDTSPAQRT